LAFILQQSWQDDGCGGRPARSVPPPLGAAWFGGRGLPLGKWAGTVLTVAVHLLLLWVFATRLAGSHTGAEASPPPPNMVNLTLASSAPVEAEAAPPRAPPKTSPAASPVDASAKTELPPPEWTVAAVAVSLRPEMGATTASADGQGTSGGGGVYDPFAGAAPLVRDAALNGMVPRGSESSLRLDDAMLALVRAAVSGANPDARGTVELALSVSADGVVLTAKRVSGSAAPVVGQDVARRLVGARLYTGVATTTVELRLTVAI
jgi:hypothetical protein